MSRNKQEEDPRINGIKTKIRVVPDFPKKGNFSSSCFSLHALFRLVENVVCLNCFLGYFLEKFRGCCTVTLTAYCHESIFLLEDVVMSCKKEYKGL